MPELHYFGLTQKRGPLAVREKIQADRDSQLALLTALSGFAAGRMVLATCERFEVYLSAAGLDRDSFAEFLSSWLRISSTEFNKYGEILSGRLVAGHLLRVAAGLESRIVGERQILGQVRNAHRNALEQSSLDAPLSMLMQSAIRLGKRVRHQTALGRGGKSIATLALDWLRHKQECVDGKTVAIVGSGRLAALIASHVVEQRPGKLIITGRDRDRALQLAERFGAQCDEFSHLGGVVAESHIAFACTASPVHIIEKAIVGGRGKPLRLVDLCVPRNVDPKVAEIPQVALVHLDDIVSREMSFAAAADTEVVRNAIIQAETMLDEELNAFLRWRHERQAVPMIADLVSRAVASGMVGRRVLHQQIMRLKAGVAI